MKNSVYCIALLALAMTTNCLAQGEAETDDKPLSIKEQCELYSVYEDENGDFIECPQTTENDG